MIPMPLPTPYAPHPTPFFPILWRLSILLLPWQTRWIFQEGMLSGFHWEAATVCIYASWLVMILTILCSMIAFRDRWIGVTRDLFVPEEKPIKGLFRRISSVWQSLRAPTWGERIRSCVQNNTARMVFFLMMIIAFILPTIFSTSPVASLLWWVNALMLVLFFISLRIADLKKETLIFWFILSII